MVYKSSVSSCLNPLFRGKTKKDLWVETGDFKVRTVSMVLNKDGKV